MFARHAALGWFELAAWHLGLHAAWRAYQFLLAPSYMHLVEAAGAAGARLAGASGGWLYGAATAALLAGITVAAGTAGARRCRRWRGMRAAFDDEVLSRLVGMPEDDAAARDRQPTRTGHPRPRPRRPACCWAAPSCCSASRAG
ncbi:MAG: hypothetical protein MZV65_17840 [Chromatiales bacterium]|nr:hypothetical protein [Chromatiales bacterium]